MECKKYYNNRVSFSQDTEEKNKEFVSLLSKGDRGCEITLFHKFKDPITVSLAKNKSLHQYDEDIILFFERSTEFRNIGYFFLSTSVKYWRIQSIDIDENKKQKSTYSYPALPLEKISLEIKNDTLDEKCILRTTQLKKLLKIKSPEQRSKGWFAQRETSITASACGAILGDDKYKLPYQFIVDKVLKPPFIPNEHCYHGKKYEEIAKLIYELEYDVHVKAFGLLNHPEHKFLAASPDGICSRFKRNKKSLSNLVGRMVEIKCPTKRKIIETNSIEEVVPIQYYHQMQQQLECCNLDECDFFQCKIVEYDSFDSFINDSTPGKEYISKYCGSYKGCVIELLPTHCYEGDILLETYDKTDFIYPKTLFMNNRQYIQWINQKITKMKKEKMAIHKIKYWRLEQKHCITVPIKKTWLKESMKKFKQAWKYVEELRSNQTKKKIFEEFLTKERSKPKYLSMKNLYSKAKYTYNDEVMKFVASLCRQKK